MEDTYINSLKNDNEGIHRFTSNDGHIYGIRVLGRGENLFFQENDKAFICEIDAVHAIIISKSINKWGDGTKIEGEEKIRVLEKVKYYYQKFYSDNVGIV